MFSKGCIIPTGNEILSGIVQDTDSPAIMQRLLQINGKAKIVRITPVEDDEDIISENIKHYQNAGFDLIILIGGSGEGHRHSTILGKDFTHDSLEKLLTTKFCTKLFGKNGHMWSELVIGILGDSLVFNVPGPYEEVTATMDAFAETYIVNNENLRVINEAMAQSLKTRYST